MRAHCLLSFLGLLLAVACGDAETNDATATTGAGGADDGLLRPEANGVQITEDNACQIVKSAVESRQSQLGCGPMTIRQCPLFLTIMPQHSPSCALYDEGAAQGCAEYYSMMSCDDLKALQNTCVVKNYPGTEPAGCP